MTTASFRDNFIQQEPEKAELQSKIERIKIQSFLHSR